MEKPAKKQIDPMERYPRTFTPAKVRNMLARIVEIRREMQPALKQEILELGELLGKGVHRSSELPGLKIGVSFNDGASYGHTKSTNWQAVATELAIAGKVPAKKVAGIVRRNTRRGIARKAAGWSVSVSADTCKKPKLRAV